MNNYLCVYINISLKTLTVIWGSVVGALALAYITSVKVYNFVYKST